MVESRGQNQKWATSGPNCYITPAIGRLSVLQSGGKNQKWPTSLRRLYTHVPKLPQFPNGYHPKTEAEKPLWKIAQLCSAGNTPKNL